MQQMIDQCTQMMRSMMGGGMMGGGMMGGGMMLPMALGALLFGVLAVLGIVLVLRLVRNGERAAQPTPLTILQERLARGEIDVAEYQQHRSMLQHERTVAPSQG